MSIESTITSFYSSVEEAGKQLLNYKKEIDDKQGAIKELIGGIRLEDEKKFGAGNEIDEMCAKQIVQYNKAIHSWQKAIGRYIEGKEFVNKFERSLLLIVFADVNAGKSSLGNFVSGYAFKDTLYGKLYSKPKLYVYDYTDKSLKSGTEKEIVEGYFEELAVQATASIQYYTLHNGLTWVDTPGIHSLTEEYEELAKDYVKFADLILFLTPSNNPWKQDEAKEVEKLVNSGKPILFAITKSDAVTLSVVNGKKENVLAPKSPENRAAQEKYVRESIWALKHDDIVSQDEYISISTRLAKTAMAEDNEELFEKSNFPKFFEQIGLVISEKAVELKMQRPRSELNFVIDELINGSEKNGFTGIGVLLENLESVIRKIEDGSKKIGLLKSEIMANARNIISNDIYSMLSRKKNGGLDDTDAISREIDTIINKNLADEIARTVGGEINDLDVQLSSADILIDAKYEKIKKTVEYTEYVAGNHARDPEGIIEHLQAFFFDKQFYEYSIRPKTRTKEIELGDNFGEYANDVWNSAQKAVEERVDKELKRIQREYYGRLADSVEEMIGRIKAVRTSLEELKY